MLSKHPLHQPELYQPPKEYPSKGTPLSTADSRTWRHSSGRPMCISLKVCTTHWRASNCGCSVSSLPILISSDVSPSHVFLSNEQAPVSCLHC
ncbi:hypothetical protein CIPAW_04G064400 [Carya illinoinensis]|uniref:Uncharacterized protein n=1 Tax=Carya illinoinensis TaxID=32201 RepID=A0A8T1QRK0_CARIL|nr:hypothetical protein CIPAW_04G064400 [Carya illinoinensis]